MGDVFQSLVPRYVAGGATKTLTAANDGNTILLDTAAGTVVTLPAATGTGNKFRFIVSVLATSNSHIVKVANSTDIMQGCAFVVDTDGTNVVDNFMAVAASSDTITLNRSTTGSVTLGEEITVEDRASGIWHVSATLSCTGTPTTPFSATV